MSTVPLVTAQFVVDQMGILDSDDGNTVIDGAILSAQIRIEADLDTLLDKQSNSDVFYLDVDAHNGIQPNGFFKLQLKNGFVRGSPAVTLYYGDTWKTQTTEMDAEWYKIDPIRGLALVDAAEFGGYYVKVVYDSGFLAYEEPPSWLREAIAGYVPMILDVKQTTNRNAEAEKVVKNSLTHAIAVMAPYSRVKGFCLKPIT